MTSSIDTSLPIQGRPTTASVRSNFAYAKTEIEALQDATTRFINVMAYGATISSSVDSTAAIQAAIDAAEALADASQGGAVVLFPSGYLRVEGTLTIQSSFVTLQGQGSQATYLLLANGTADGIVVGNAGGTATRCQAIRDMAINGSNKTAGANIKVVNTFNTLFDRLQVENCIIGFDLAGANNSITIRDTIIVPNQAGSTHGIYWHDASDGTSRSDVLTLNNVVISAQWSDATCIEWDGFCATMVASHLRMLGAAYGLRVRNTGASASYYPMFLNAFDLEIEGFKNRAISIEAGAEFKIVGSDMNNLTGGHISQGSADDYAVYVGADAGASITRAVNIVNSRIGGCQQSGLYSECQDLQIASSIFYSTSMAGSGSYPVISLGAATDKAHITNVIAEAFGGAARGSYGIEVADGATRVQVLGFDCSTTVTGAINDLTSASIVSALGVISPSSNLYGLHHFPDLFRTRQLYNNNGGNEHVVQNASTGANAYSRHQETTGTANSYHISQVSDGGGTPEYFDAVGPGVTVAYHDAPIHRFRLVNGTVLLKIGEALTEYADDAAAATGGLPVGGYYRTASVVKQRVA